VSLQVLTVEGPLVGMAAAYYALPAGQTAVQLTAQLSAPPLLPVSAAVSLEQRTAAGVPQVSAENSEGDTNSMLLREQLEAGQGTGTVEGTT